MTISKIIAMNIISILKSTKLSLEWLEEITGVSSLKISEGRDFSALDVFRIVAALDVSIKMLTGNGPTSNMHVPYHMSRKKTEMKAKRMYYTFWDNIIEITGSADIRLSEISTIAGLSTEQIFLCSVGFDTKIERLLVISQYLHMPIDSLVSPIMIPASENLQAVPEKLAVGF